MPNPRIINTWDEVLKDYHDYSWDTKGIIADAINVAADGVITVSQNGNYYDYGEAIRQMDKRIWSSANEPTNPRKQVQKTFPNYAEAQEFCTRIDELGVETVTDVTQNADGTVTVTYLTYCVIRNSDLAPGYGKYTNYGYVDINELSEKRFGDYDKYHAASSFYVDIYNPPVFFDDGHVEGEMTYYPEASTADISGLASATVTESTAEGFAAALYTVLATLFPDAYPDAAGARWIHLPSMHAIVHVTFGSPYQLNWIFSDDIHGYEPGGCTIPSTVGHVYGLRDEEHNLVMLFTDNGSQYFFVNDGSWYWYAANDTTNSTEWNTNSGVYPVQYYSNEFYIFDAPNSGFRTPYAPSDYGIFQHKVCLYSEADNNPINAAILKALDIGKLNLGYWYQWGDKPLFSKFTCNHKSFRYLGNQYYWEVD